MLLLLFYFTALSGCHFSSLTPQSAIAIIKLAFGFNFSVERKQCRLLLVLLCQSLMTRLNFPEDLNRLDSTLWNRYTRIRHPIMPCLSCHATYFNKINSSSPSLSSSWLSVSWQSIIYCQLHKISAFYFIF